MDKRNKDLENIFVYSLANSLPLNIDKFKYMVIHSKPFNSVNNCDIRANGVNFEFVDQNTWV